MKIKKINFPSIIEIPGVAAFNMSIKVNRTLPSDWDGDTRLKVKLPFFNKWAEIPCIGSW